MMPDELAVPAAEPPPAPPADQGGDTPDQDGEPTTLAEHEARYGDTARAAAESAAEPDPDAARDAKGRFLTRHRAASQAATADDVPTIAALTKRIKDAEAAQGREIVAQPGESPRVFELRRRAELAERRTQVPAVPAPVAQRPPPPPVASPVTPPAAPAAPEKPDPEKFAYGTSDPGYLAALTEWQVDTTLTARERVRAEAAAVEQRRAEGARIAADWQTRVAAAQTKYPDFAAVALRPDAIIPTVLARGTIGEAFVYEDPAGADVLYYLLTHADEALRLGAHVANPMSLFRELTLLGQRLTTPPAQAVSTGSAARQLPPAAPRPPNPVRTGPLTTGDPPPDDDDQSLANHERYFGRRR